MPRIGCVYCNDPCQSLDGSGGNSSSYEILPYWLIAQYLHVQVNRCARIYPKYIFTLILASVVSLYFVLNSFVKLLCGLHIVSRPVRDRKCALNSLQSFPLISAKYKLVQTIGRWWRHHTVYLHMRKTVPNFLSPALTLFAFCWNQGPYIYMQQHLVISGTIYVATPTCSYQGNIFVATNSYQGDHICSNNQLLCTQQWGIWLPLSYLAL